MNEINKIALVPNLLRDFVSAFLRNLESITSVLLNAPKLSRSSYEYDEYRKNCCFS